MMWKTMFRWLKIWMFSEMWSIIQWIWLCVMPRTCFMWELVYYYFLMTIIYTFLYIQFTYTYLSFSTVLRTISDYHTIFSKPNFGQILKMNLIGRTHAPFYFSMLCYAARRKNWQRIEAFIGQTMKIKQAQLKDIIYKLELEADGRKVKSETWQPGK